MRVVGLVRVEGVVRGCEGCGGCGGCQGCQGCEGCGGCDGWGQGNPVVKDKKIFMISM